MLLLLVDNLALRKNEQLLSEIKAIKLKFSQFCIE
jgi:hypothetical protein